MIPNMNPKMMKQAMKKMGIKQEEIDAIEVIIKTGDREIVITDPQVSKVNMMGQETFQVVGNIHEREVSTMPEINEDDIKTVMDQASVDEDAARKALESSNGDLAEAIINLQGSDE